MIFFQFTLNRKVSVFFGMGCPLLFCLCLCTLGCEFKSKSQLGSDPVKASANRGRITYQTQCIACHNTDPKKPGALGPEVFGSSKELLEARIMRGEYPPGYAPKRPTKTMARLPHLKNEIDALYDYLNK